jgi:hypothetical protein
MRDHRSRQQAERDRACEQRHDSGNVFTAPDGSPLHPDWLTRRFRRLVTVSGLPPVRLHDLRHGAVSLALAAGADLKTVQALLGTPASCSPRTFTPASSPNCSPIQPRPPPDSSSPTPPTHPADAPATASQAARQSPRLQHQPDSRNPSGPSDPTADTAGRRASHTRPTHVPQRSRPHSHEAIRPGHTGAPSGTRTTRFTAPGRGGPEASPCEPGSRHRR